MACYFQQLELMHFLIIYIKTKIILYKIIQRNNYQNIKFIKQHTGYRIHKNLIHLNSSIKPFTISRVQSEYNSEEIESDICSATAIRTSLKENTDLFI